MSKFEPKSFQQIVSSMAAKLSAETPISDFTDGSVSLTLLETAAQEDFQQYVQMLNILRNFNLDTTEGEDLDNKAAEFGITRRVATPHSGFVTITDSRFTKIATKLFAGQSGPTSGALVIFVDDASNFPASGSVFIGRGTPNSEGSITYSVAPVDNISFWTITLDTALINDHGTDESVILSQFGNRTITAGTEVEVPETDVSDRVPFEINQTVELLDGEDTITDVLVTALEPGGFRVPANSVISFPNSPFTGATVANPLPFVNGQDEETDQKLRDRIRETIQALSRGTRLSIANGILGLLDETTNSTIVSTSIVPPVNLADGPTKVFIDNGRGLEPEFASVGLESIITQATGGEQFFQLQNFPLVKASVVSQNTETFGLVGLETLVIRVGTDEETFTFQAIDFEILGRARATEVSEAINNRSVLSEARTITDEDGRKVILTPRARVNENIQIDSNSTAQPFLNFTELEVETLKLYKNDKLITKDGLTASLSSGAQPFNLDTNVVTTTDGDITVTAGSRIVTKTVPGADPLLQLVHPGDYIKFSSDTDDFYAKVRTVVSDIKFILESDYNALGGGTGDITIWNSPQLEVAANGDICETEVVSFSPNDFGNASQALASEVVTRMQQEINLSTVEVAVNNTRVKVISNLENSVNSRMQITGGAGALALGYSTSSALTGTLDFVGGDRIVTGTSTAFTSELQEGQWIKANSDGAGAWTKIETIENDTTLYLSEGYRGTDGSAVAASTINFSEATQGKNKDYILNRSNGQIETTNPLELGDDLTAGSINTRAFVDSLQETFDFDSLGATSTLIVEVDTGIPGVVSTGDAVAPFNNFFASNLIGFESGLFDGFFLRWETGNNAGETSFVASYDNSTGEITTVTDFTNAVVISDRFILAQVLTFTHISDFADPENATAQEVADAINSQILGGQAEVLDNNSVRIRTSNFSEEGAIKIESGSANSILGFATSRQLNQLTNTAFTTSQNSDRNGNPLAAGYTLGPNQNFVVILDEDSVNKTFSTIMQVTDSATGGGTGTFASSGVATKYPTDDFFNDFWLYWTGGANDGSVQIVTDYVGATGTFTLSDIFPTVIGAISSGDTFAIVPRTAENVVAILNDLNTTTLSISGTIETTGITGDFVQLSTNTPGSDGKVFVTGGTANSIGIAIEGIPGGAPVNDFTVNSTAGLAKGLFVHLTVDGAVTTDDTVIPFDTFRSDDMIFTTPGYFTGLEIEFLTGDNAGFKTTIASYDNTTGEIVLTVAATNEISLDDTFRIFKPAYITDISGASAPFTIEVTDAASVAIDVSGYSPQRLGAVRDVNGFDFGNTQVEGIDGYKYYTGLIQKAQFTIDGLDRDPANFPGIGAAGTQFEVNTSVLVRLNLTVDVTTNQGVSLSSITSDVSNAILQYVNSLGVGDDVVLSEIIAAAQSVDGVFDVTVSNFIVNVVISDNELARLDAPDLTIG